ncbi:MAG: hypothetical protein E7188_04345 [Erysipelotrichaceae bacterium]|nr:hypothetical protein [Erysipelotrichaceae bacterium]
MSTDDWILITALAALTIGVLVPFIVVAGNKRNPGRKPLFTIKLSETGEKVLLFAAVFAVVGFLIYTGMMQYLAYAIEKLLSTVTGIFMIALFFVGPVLLTSGLTFGSFDEPESTSRRNPSKPKPRKPSRAELKRARKEAFDRQLEKEIDEEMEEDDWDEEHGIW